MCSTMYGILGSKLLYHLFKIVRPPQQKTHPTHQHTYKLTYKLNRTEQKQYIQIYIQASGTEQGRSNTYKLTYKTEQKQYIQTYIQASTQNRAEAIHTSIYKKQSRHIPTRIPTKHTHKTEQKSPPNSTPQKAKQQKLLPYKIVSIV